MLTGECRVKRHSPISCMERKMGKNRVSVFKTLMYQVAG